MCLNAILIFPQKVCAVQIHSHGLCMTLQPDWAQTVCTPTSTVMGTGSVQRSNKNTPSKKQILQQTRGEHRFSSSKTRKQENQWTKKATTVPSEPWLQRSYLRVPRREGGGKSQLFGSHTRFAEEFISVGTVCENFLPVLKSALCSRRADIHTLLADVSIVCPIH